MVLRWTSQKTYPIVFIKTIICQIFFSIHSIPFYYLIGLERHILMISLFKFGMRKFFIRGQLY
jgi:hypothetical protein